MSAARARLARFVRSSPVLSAPARRIARTWFASRSRWEQLRHRGLVNAEQVTRQNTREAYETLFGSARLLAQYLEPSRTRLYDEVAAVCLEGPCRSILDAGCGGGDLLKAVAERARGVERLAGFDHASTGIARARTLVPHGQWKVGDIYDPPFDESFDVVVCTEVLEHLREPERALAQLGRRRAEGGRLVVTVPDGETDDWEGHVNFWSAETLAELLEPFGEVEIRRIAGGGMLLAVVGG